MKHTIKWAVLAAACIATSQAASTITYEDSGLPLNSHIDNTSFTTGGATHTNINPGGFWEGFALSTHTDTTTPGWGNQYSSYTGGGAAMSTTYAVGYYGAYLSTSIPSMTFSEPVDATGMSASFTNTTYAVLDMLSGSSFNGNRPFGGPSGNDADYLKLTLTGYLNSVATGSTELYLADYRFTNNAQDFILNSWTSLSFAPLGTAVNEIRFAVTSSDFTTPTYFAMDNVVIPEPSSSALLAAGLVGALFRRRRI